MAYDVKQRMDAPAVACHQKRIVKMLLDEVAAALHKFPDFPTDPVHRAAIVAEEAGELVQASLQRVWENGSDEQMIREAVQTGAMAIRFLANVLTDPEGEEVWAHRYGPGAGGYVDAPTS